MSTDDTTARPLSAEEEAALRLFCERNSHGIPFRSPAEGAVLTRRLLATLDSERAAPDVRFGIAEPRRSYIKRFIELADGMEQLPTADDVFGILADPELRR